MIQPERRDAAPRSASTPSLLRSQAIPCRATTTTLLMGDRPSSRAAERAPTAGHAASETERYRRLLAIFEGYVSRSNAKASLDVALKRLGLGEERIGASRLERVVSETMIGLRLFCPTDRVGDLMVDLAEFCEAESGEGTHLSKGPVGNV